jgi:hypothetical protein
VEVLSSEVLEERGGVITRGPIRSVVNYGEGAIRSAKTITHGSF